MAMLRIKTGNDTSISDINLVGCRPVIPEYTKLKCVQQASISTRVSNCVSYGTTLLCRAGYIATLCRAFLLYFLIKNNFLEPNYIRIYFFFTMWQV